MIFFYGLFMDVALLRGKGLDPRNVRHAVVRGRALRIGRRSALVHLPGGVAHGMLMDLTHGEIERLYADPGVAMYRPEAVTAEPDDGTRVAALCFNLPVAPGPHEANPEYVASWRDLARRLGFPEAHVAGIR